MEQYITIPTLENGVQIHGVLRGEYSQPLAILAPGLGGWMHDLLLFNAARHFEQEGIATLRVSFYGHDDHQRNIGDFDVKANASDIDSVVKFAKNKGASWICVVGHSYSGMAVVYSKEQAFDTAVLWDPSHTDGYNDPQAIENLAQDFLYIEELDAYVSAAGPGYVLSRKVFENFSPGSSEMAKRFRVPSLIINAELSGTQMERYGQDYMQNIDAETNHEIIVGASHPFTEDGAMKKLFQVTTSWIKNQYIQ